MNPPGGRFHICEIVQTAALHTSCSDVALGWWGSQVMAGWFYALTLLRGSSLQADRFALGPIALRPAALQ